LDWVLGVPCTWEMGNSSVTTSPPALIAIVKKRWDFLLGNVRTVENAIKIGGIEITNHPENATFRSVKNAALLPKIWRSVHAKEKNRRGMTKNPEVIPPF